MNMPSRYSIQMFERYENWPMNSIPNDAVKDVMECLAWLVKAEEANLAAGCSELDAKAYAYNTLMHNASKYSGV